MQSCIKKVRSNQDGSRVKMKPGVQPKMYDTKNYRGKPGYESIKIASSQRGVGPDAIALHVSLCHMHSCNSYRST